MYSRWSDKVGRFAAELVRAVTQAGPTCGVASQVAHVKWSVELCTILFLRRLWEI